MVYGNLDTPNNPNVNLSQKGATLPYLRFGFFGLCKLPDGNVGRASSHA